MTGFAFLILFVTLGAVSARHSSFTKLNEHWICGVKKTCFDCLKLPHCSWCGTENRCFSKKLAIFKDFCTNSTVNHDEGYGLSLEENAECSCEGGKTHLHCYPPGTTEGPECSGRGICSCGHCICDPNPDPENPTKVIMGDHCEFDNFSCDGPKCNEGPYSISQPVIVDDDFDKTDDFDGAGR